MTEIAVLADPPHPGVLPELVETAPLSGEEAQHLYTAMLRDVCRAAEDSGGDLLVNYRPADAVPGVEDSEAALRDVLDGVVDEARYEVQVGETFAGRVGNTVTHLLDREGVSSAAALEPTAALLTRQVIDEAAMKLRSREVVLGPAADGRVYYAAFTDPVDFEAAYTAPAVSTLTDRALDAGLDVDFLRTLPVVETGTDLAATLVAVDARGRAGRSVPMYFVDAVDDLGLTTTVDEDGTPTLGR
jgi:glycosyltransferase A (GT-A) superfamily protein (DUF2064 family)